MKRVLILCTGNSARSQMAEGLLRHMAGDRFEVASAGVSPTRVRPEAIEAMREIGIDISTHRSKSVDEFAARQFDYVITVCDNANEQCPVFPAGTTRIHWSFDDPAAAEGDEPARLAVFRRVRDEIEQRLEEFNKMAQPTNVINEWRESAKYWTKHNATIRTMFAPLTQALIEHAGIHEGQKVLDVAGGTGEPSLTIAEVVGPTGSVMCTDAVSEMVETARSEANRRGLTNVQFQQCVADSLPFPDNSFDVVVCRLGAMFFPDAHAAVREMLRVTKPGGALACAVWHKSEVNPFCHVVTSVMDKHIEPTVDAPDAPSAFRFAEPDKLANVMREAGASDVEETVFKFDMAAPVSPSEFWNLRSQASDTLRQKLSKLSEDEQSRIASEIEEAVQEFFPANQMKFPAQMVIATGKKRNN